MSSTNLRYCLTAFLVLAPLPALAEDPAPVISALGQLAQDAQTREARALVEVYTLRAQLATQTKRAEEAEKKLKPADPSEGKAP